MKMKLRRYTSASGSVLILDTNGRAPADPERQLLCCRSLTLPVDALLLGPLDPAPPFQVLALDVEGQPLPLTQTAAAAFAAFLRDSQKISGSVSITDGIRTYVIPAGDPAWQAESAPEGRELLRLLGISEGGPVRS